MNVYVAEPTPEEFRETFGLLIAMHAEAGAAPLDHAHAGQKIYAVLEGVQNDPITSLAINARNDAGEMIGTLGLVRAAFWYNPAVTYWTDNWFYVRPEARGGKVGAELMDWASSLGKQTKSFVHITVTNPKRRVKLGRHLESVGYGFVPFATTVSI